jgi:hypothetical protein
MNETRMRDKKVERVMKNVRSGDRSRADLKRCGCETCMEALRRLDKRRKKVCEHKKE